MGDDSPIVQHLRAGQDQRARIDEGVAAFRRLSPSDYGHFLATIEGDLGGDMPEISSGGVRAGKLLLAAPAKEPPSGSLREAVLGLLADGRARSTLEIRRELEEHRPVNHKTLNTEIFTLRKMGLLRSEGNGHGRRHTRTSGTGAASKRAATGKRETTTRAPRSKRDDDEDHPGRGRIAAPDAVRTNSARSMRDEDHSDSRTRSAAPDAAQIYASAISGHHLLTGAEELELARRLEETEIGLWERLMDGPLAAEAQKLLLALDPPVVAKDAREARAVDLDRLIVTHLIEGADPKDKRLVKEIAALRPITAEADRIRERFTICNLRLVPSTIRRHGYHLKTNLAMSDLIQEGNLGLLKAISRYDYRRGLRFSTFATWWIRHYLVRARQNSGEVRVPVHLHDLASKVRRAKAELREKLGHDPDRRELASAIKVPEQSLKTLESDWLKHREALPAFDSVGSEEGETPSYLASEEALADEILTRHQEDDQLAAVLVRLPPLLVQIVRRRFGIGGCEPETLKEVGKALRLSRERIRQLEKKALAVLRQALDEIEDDVAA